MEGERERGGKEMWKNSHSVGRQNLSLMGVGQALGLSGWCTTCIAVRFIPFLPTKYRLVLIAMRSASKPKLFSSSLACCLRLEHAVNCHDATNR